MESLSSSLCSSLSRRFNPFPPAAYCSAEGARSVPSILSGLVVRFSASKAYRLGRLSGVQQGPDGKPQLLLRVRLLGDG